MGVLIPATAVKTQVKGQEKFCMRSKVMILSVLDVQAKISTETHNHDCNMLKSQENTTRSRVKTDFEVRLWLKVQVCT